MEMFFYRCKNVPFTLKFYLVQLFISFLIVSAYVYVMQMSSQIIYSMKSMNNHIPTFGVSLERENKNNQTLKNFSHTRLPTCIIFGVSKGGTRAVLEYLKMHPDVVAPSRELHYFDNASLQNEKGLKWYLQQLPVSKISQIVIDKSPDYFQHPESAELIFQANNKTKLILLLRDPVERLVSQYVQLTEKNPGLPPFEDWVIDVKSGEVNNRHPSVMVSAYSKFLVHWLAVFPRHQIHIIESLSLRLNPFAEMQLVEKFLGLKPFLKHSDFYFNATRGFHCMRFRFSGSTQCLGKSKGRIHPAVREDVLDKLRKFYHPYNMELNRLLNLEFPWM